MGKLALIALALALAACGSDHAKPDASIPTDSQPIDAKPIDAEMIDAPSYDFSCLGNTGKTTAPDTVTVSGTTVSVGSGGGSPIGGVALAVYKVSAPTVALDTTTSATDGSFSATLSTGGVPLDTFITATLASYRTSYVYTAQPIAASATGVDLPVIAQATFAQLSSALGNQDDTKNGALLVTTLDCSGKSITNATLAVTQGGTPVGTVVNLGFASQTLADVFFVFNVPDGDTQVSASASATTFPETPRTITAHEAPAGGEGTLTIVTLIPGPTG